MLVLDPKRALVSQAVGRELVRDAAATLGGAGIPLMPLKGAWLQACVYGPSEARVITDVDVLVPERAYEHAIERLVRAGYRVQSGNVSEVALAHPAWPLPLDLHRRLFSRGAFRLPTSVLFRRARPDRSKFGVHVYLPDPRDAFAHLCGHFVKSRADPHDPMRLTDFVLVARRCRLEPQDCARHLQAAGMGRAARYALHELGRRDDEPFFGELLRALPRDPMARTFVRAARVAARASGRNSALGAVPGFLLERSVWSGARTLVLRALDKRHDFRTELAHDDPDGRMP